MDILSTGVMAAAGLSQLVNLIAKMRTGYKPSLSDLKKINGEISPAARRSIPSLTAFGRQANVIGRVYIENSIAQDDIAIPLMGILNQMYVCWIITALGLDSVCADGRTVREKLALVAGESYVDQLISDIRANFGVTDNDKLHASTEAKVIDVDPDTQRLVCGRLIELDFNLQSIMVTNTNSGATMSKTSQDDSVTKTTQGPSTTETTQGPSTTKTTQGLSTSDSTNYAGSQFTMNETGDKIATTTPGKTSSTTNVGDKTATTSTGDKTTVTTGGNTRTTTSVGAGSASMLKVYMYVQMVPYILQQEVCAGFMGVNFAPTLSTRLKQLRAGEISFIKDFIFARDLIKKQEKMLKKDNTGMVTEMMIRQRNKLFLWAFGLTGFLPETHNLANAVMIVNKQTFDQSCRDAHINFNSAITRDKFFAKTFTMVVVVVDPMYGTVTMYFAGLPAVATYSYNMVNKVGARNKDSFDFKEVMTAFAQGQTPRF